MTDSTMWEVHLYAPAETRPASNERFASFKPAFEHALSLKQDRPHGWHVHVHPPAHASTSEIAKLQENSLYPA
jgi:hypothetical protein